MGASGFDDANVVGLFQSRYEDRFEGSWASDVSLFNPESDSEIEKYGIFGGHPKMREWIGQRQATTVNKKQYEIRNKPYESSLVVPERMLSRDKSGLLEAHVGEFAGAVVAEHWEDLLIDLINTNGLCYDGQNFFDVDHVWGDSGTQKNEVTQSEIAVLNVGTPTAPTPTEAANALMALVAHMLTFKDDKGRYVNGSARKFVVAVSTVNLFTAVQQAITSNLLTGIVDNPLNGMKQGGFSFRVLPIFNLTSATDKIRIFRTDGTLKPFILQQEQPPEYSLLGRGSDFHFENKAIKLGVDASRGAGYGLWEHAISGTLS